MENIVTEAAAAFETKTRELSQHATDLELSKVVAGTKRELTAAAIKYLSENPGRYPDAIMLVDMVKKSRAEAAEIAKTAKPEAGEIVATGGAI